MKYDDIIQILKNTIKVMQDPMYIANKLEKGQMFKLTKNLDLNSSMDNNIYAENENINKEYNDIVPREDDNSYDDNKSSGYYNEQQYTSSDSRGMIESIAQGITPVRLQQAIILSEIVGKPRSKTRKKRRI